MRRWQQTYQAHITVWFLTSQTEIKRRLFLEKNNRDVWGKKKQAGNPELLKTVTTKSVHLQNDDWGFHFHHDDWTSVFTRQKRRWCCAWGRPGSGRPPPPHARPGSARRTTVTTRTSDCARPRTWSAVACPSDCECCAARLSQKAAGKTPKTKDRNNWCEFYRRKLSH